MKKSFKNDCEQAQLTKLATDVEATTQMYSEKWLWRILILVCLLVETDEINQMCSKK